jgi:hypothetical protein
MDFVAFVEKEVGEIATVLSCDAGDECFFHEIGVVLTRPAGLHFACRWAD